MSPRWVMAVVDLVREALGLGLEPKEFGVLQVCLRGVLVFSASLIIVRLGHKRFMARLTAFDTVLGFMLASALARAINGSAPLLPTLAGALLLVLLHRFLSALSFRYEWIGNCIKGRSDVLIKAGRIDRDKLRAHRISENDLLEEARLNGKIERLSNVGAAILERNGKISVIPREKAE